MKTETTKLNITLPKYLINKINNGNYNRNKLLITLLINYTKK